MEAERGFTSPLATITLTKEEGEVVARLILGKEKHRENTLFVRNDMDGTDYLVSRHQSPAAGEQLRTHTTETHAVQRRPLSP